MDLNNEVTPQLTDLSNEVTPQLTNINHMGSHHENGAARAKNLERSTVTLHRSHTVRGAECDGRESSSVRTAPKRAYRDAKTEPVYCLVKYIRSDCLRWQPLQARPTIPCSIVHGSIKP